ncbi:hypothetical protein Poly51_63250 [Rubripirellula tenax]|uniref:Uncharacterized protein n=1 Tax=Rubripirellula tenax TaxID=2528015 RepID=A0A5C6E1Q6_9BACT|nr:hypothetical protein [Rubripirellula tenax]TWU43583.1 hypothetical protein Poly51_63250 [Rubripirellula tenax]
MFSGSTKSGLPDRGSGYGIDCACGNRLIVSASQAGGVAACRCGSEVSVPPLSQLKSTGPQPTDSYSEDFEALKRSLRWSVLLLVVTVIKSLAAAVAVVVILAKNGSETDLLPLVIGVGVPLGLTLWVHGWFQRNCGDMEDLFDQPSQSRNGLAKGMKLGGIIGLMLGVVTSVCYFLFAATEGTDGSAKFLAELSAVTVVASTIGLSVILGILYMVSGMMHDMKQARGN